MVYAQTEAGKVYELEGTTGSVRWEYIIDTEYTETDSRHLQRMAIDEDSIYVVDYTRRLHAIDRQTGDSRWKTQISSSESSALFNGRVVPTIVGDRVFLAEYPDRLLGFDVESGERVIDSSMPARRSPFPTIAEANGELYTANSFGDDDLGQEASHPSLSKFRAEGDHVWTSVQTTSNYNVNRPPAVEGDKVYLTDSSWIYALRASNGELIWEGSPNKPVQHGNFSWHSPAIGTERLVYANDWHQTPFAISAVSSSTGAVEWHHYLGDKLYALPPVVVGDIALVSSDQDFLAFSIEDGSRLWELDVGNVISFIAGDGFILTGAGSELRAWA